MFPQNKKLLGMDSGYSTSDDSCEESPVHESSKGKAHISCFTAVCSLFSHNYVLTEVQEPKVAKSLSASKKRHLVSLYHTIAAV